MRIADLQEGSSVEEITVDVVEKGEPREVTSRSGQPLRVCDATVQDDEGDQVSFTLWNDEIDDVSEGDRIVVKNGWVSTYQNELQLSTGKFGSLEKA